MADESKACRSPFAGVVSRVSAQLGQAIQVNDVLLVLEAPVQGDSQVGP